MPRPKLTRLNRSVRVIATTKEGEKKNQMLKQAFDLFSKEAQELKLAHEELRNRYQALNHELEATNRTLKNKVAELDFVSFYLNNILDNISQGILFIDLTGSVTTYNAAAETILEVPAGKVLFHKFWQNFTDDLFGFSIREALTKKTAPNQAKATLPKEGTLHRIIEVNTTFMAKELPHSSDATTSLQGLVVLIRDISEMKRLELIDARNDKMKELGEMASMVAHEIRNPLGGIKGFASLLQRDLKDEPELQRLAGYIVEGTDSLNRLVSDILDYSHPMQLRIEAVDVIELMQELILHLNADESIDPRIELHCHSPHKHLLAAVDGVSLKSAVMNLSSNAIQAMPEGGELLIDVDIDGQDLMIKVSDTGIGIPQENISKIFTPFFTTRARGHGLGLTEVHRIVQAHDGVLEVTSEKDKGTTFTIRIPYRTVANYT